MGLFETDPYHLGDTYKPRPTCNLPLHAHPVLQSVTRLARLAQGILRAGMTPELYPSEISSLLQSTRMREKAASVQVTQTCPFRLLAELGL